MWQKGTFFKGVQKDSGKRQEAAPRGQSVANQPVLSHTCAFWKSKERDTLFKQCSKCKNFLYCSQTCQHRHWGEHKTLCLELCYLNEWNCRKNQVNEGTYTCHLSPREGATVVHLVGNKCTVECSLNGVITTALCDTGAQVSIVSHDWVLNNLPEAEVRTVETLGVTELDLKAANWTALPYNGWIKADFKLMGTNHGYGIKVPFLVSRDALDLPIIGYNVIEEITRNSASGISTDQQPLYLDGLTSSL